MPNLLIKLLKKERNSIRCDQNSLSPSGGFEEKHKNVSNRLKTNNKEITLHYVFKIFRNLIVCV